MRERWQGVGKGRGFGRGLGRGSTPPNQAPIGWGESFLKGLGLAGLQGTCWDHSSACP